MTILECGTVVVFQEKLIYKHGYLTVAHLPTYILNYPLSLHGSSFLTFPHHVFIWRSRTSTQLFLHFPESQSTSFPSFILVLLDYSHLNSRPQLKYHILIEDLFESLTPIPILSSLVF